MLHALAQHKMTRQSGSTCQSTLFIAAFFNKESEVKVFTDGSRERWLEQSANVNVYPKPKVVLLEGYSTGSWSAEGWQVAVSEHRLHGRVQMGANCARIVRRSWLLQLGLC